MTQKELDPSLRATLTEWLEWAEAHPYPVRLNYAGNSFSGTHGLCRTVITRVTLLGQGQLSALLSEDSSLSCSVFPFGGPDVYYEEKKQGTLHMNAERLAWVRKVLSS